MSALLLAPHNDDETLFAAFTVLRHRPHVVTCLKAYIQANDGGPDHRVREEETQRALFHLQAPSWQQLPCRDDTPDWDMLQSLINELATEQPWDVVFAPAIEEGGHDQHNEVGRQAVKAFGKNMVTPYLTYRRGLGKSKGRNEVPFEPQWIATKLRAMGEYESQAALSSTAYWFCDETLREWYE
jgi:LmbE family N-acetylglucosaminyl deacetylase